MDTPYYQWAIESALERVVKLREKSPKDSKAVDFYHTIEDCLRAVQMALQQTRNHDALCRRIDILEKLVLLHLPKEEFLTHKIMDSLKHGEPHGTA